MIEVQDILELHEKTVDRWHEKPIDNTYEGFLFDVCTQHCFNYQLWHEEDLARSTDADDSVIARVKRAIDGFNQKRNDWIEKLDDHIASHVESLGIEISDDIRLNTETPGSVMDRLSILALRIYHLQEQLGRVDVDSGHMDRVKHRIAVCLLQRNDLATALRQLLGDIFSGKKRHRTYRQFKMYNDPTLNPYLYDTKMHSTETV